jgi:transcriptional regulator with XRE-family HTH domain
MHRGAKGVSDATLSIGEVSELLNISPGIIRMWERERLIQPDRSKGSHRLFRSQHLERLRQIADLYFSQKLNPAAIRRELGQATTAATVDNMVDARLGERLRTLRLERGMTLAQTAAAADLSSSFISALERGNSGISLEALFRLAEALGTTLPALNGADLAPAERQLVRAGEGQRFVTDEGRLIIEDIVSGPVGLEAQISRMAPGCHSGGDWAHHGQEFVHVLQGSLSIWLQGDQFHALNAGDTLYFRSNVPHRWANETDTWATVLWVNTTLPSRPEAISEPRPGDPVK